MEQSHSNGRLNQDVKNIKTAFFLNLTFTIIEIMGGIYVNSVAIISDAVHDIGDTVVLGSSWYFQKLSHKGRNESYSYGYGRFSILSAIINSIILLIGSVYILFKSIPRILNPEQPNVNGMILLALLGIIVNGLAVFKTRHGKSINEKVVSLHLLEDALGWVGILIGSIIMKYFNIPIIDPLLSVLIACYILYHSYKSAKLSFKVILQGTPESIDIRSIEKSLLEIPDVIEIHDMHSWSMNGEFHILTLHLVLSNEILFENRILIKKTARSILSRAGVNHATIELELINEREVSVDQHY